MPYYELLKRHKAFKTQHDNSLNFADIKDFSFNQHKTSLF